MRRSRDAVILSLLTICATTISVAIAGAQTWDVDRATGPELPALEYVATEGTWVSVDVAPDGRTLVFDLLGHIYEMSIQGGEARRLTSGRSWNMYPRYSPDGASIAFTSDAEGSEDLWVMEHSTGALRNVSRSPIPVHRGTWSADGRFLYASTRDHGLRTRALQVSLIGSTQELLQAPGPANQFVDVPGRDLLYFEHNDRPLYGSGARIRSYDKRTGELGTVIERPGGAMNPALSPDGSRLAYVHRSDQETQLVVRDLGTGRDRVLVRGLDRDRQEYRIYHHGTYPNMAWHPDGGRIVVSYGGAIHAVDAGTGEARAIPFQALVTREIAEPVRFPVTLPERDSRSRSHRWAHRTDAGILYETLGDIYLHDGSEPRNLTNATDHATSPVYDARTRTVYYASWSDDDHGAIYARRLDRGRPERLASAPAQYGSLALSPDGSTLAFLRSSPGGTPFLARQSRFDLVVLGPDRRERVLTGVRWGDQDGQGSLRPLKNSPVLVFDPHDESLYFTEFAGQTMSLKRIRLDGTDETVVYEFPHAVLVVPSPDLRWIAFQEYYRSYVTPFEFVGRPITISGHDRRGRNIRIDPEDGMFLRWSSDSRTLSWTRGATFMEKPLAAILGGVVPEIEAAGTASPVTAPADRASASASRGGGGGADAENGAAAARRTDLSVPFDIYVPESAIAFTGARVLTMNEDRDVLKDATILVRRDRIVAVGPDVDLPADAPVYHLDGHTIIPGIVDVHAHYGTESSVLNVVEQRVPGLHAGLAYGVTTMVEVSGSPQKDYWVSDMVRRGDLLGPRLLSVGAPIYGVREFRPRRYRSIESLDDAREHVRWNQAFGATALKDYLTRTRAIRQQLTIAAREAGVNLVSEPAGDGHLNLARVVDGTSGLEHSMGLTPLHSDVIRLLAASGAGVTPTLVTTLDGARGTAYFFQTERLWEDEKLTRFIPADYLQAFRRRTFHWEDDQVARKMAANVKRLWDAGVSIQLGGHGEMPGLDSHWEMELLAQGGFEPHDILEIASIRGATYHGLDAQIGSIEAGKLADFVVLTENPLDDIRNTRSIRYVVKNGAVYSGEDASRVYPDPRPAGRMYFMPEDR